VEKHIWRLFGHLASKLPAGNQGRNTSESYLATLIYDQLVAALHISKIITK
jgi:hypothetical protein